jgi:hypothetical protein
MKIETGGSASKAGNRNSGKGLELFYATSLNRPWKQ